MDEILADCQRGGNGRADYLEIAAIAARSQRSSPTRTARIWATKGVLTRIKR
ncbi:hypothetical protein [Streptomyces sp. NBC_01217]|uniref:hypothetical protein n=1 Tax=Streptomyces sp. NBC_01217 TaxID=2903779 RepID=UPI002E0E41C2|nr:hypothetical protein OG507_04580 [Streptomyces sp. NBC_01217]